jgi:hypothetical protein
MPVDPRYQPTTIPPDELPPLLRRETFSSKIRRYLGPIFVVAMIVLKFGAS